jgi:hypothetical protein
VAHATCSLPGCERMHYGKGYCRGHYRRLKRYGDPLGWKHQQTEACEVPSCGSKPWARSMCTAHYQKWRQYGDPLADRNRKPQSCTIAACDKPAHGRGWCHLHYQRWRSHGDPEWQAPRFEECVIDGCGKAPRSAKASMCEAHYCRIRRNGTLESGQCAVCQEPLPSGSTRQRRYCEPCNLDRRRARGRDQEHRRRVAMLSGASERIDSLEIYERDGWKCGLCHRRVNPTLAWPNPQSPSLDHIVPLVQGGRHVRTNVQLAHLGCNARKQHRGGGEQLMLIG